MGPTVASYFPKNVPHNFPKNYLVFSSKLPRSLKMKKALLATVTKFLLVIFRF